MSLLISNGKSDNFPIISFLAHLTAFFASAKRDLSEKNRGKYENRRKFIVRVCACMCVAENYRFLSISMSL